MKRGYNELVGLRATFSRALPRYSLTHLYRWTHNGATSRTGSMRSYDMRRSEPIAKMIHSIGATYHGAILSIWRQRTKACITMYYQFEVGNTPKELALEGDWEHWAQL